MQYLKLIAFCLFLFPSFSEGQFIGSLHLVPQGCEHIGKCTLKETLRYKDSLNVDWEAAAGLETDGASIPAFLQPIIGKPFETGYIKAAIIHDHYCKRHVRPWRQTHLVFYDGLISQGISEDKAKLMYFAVYLAGPKWVELVPGKKCPGNCINEITTLSGNPVIRYREADYNLFDMNAELSALQRKLETDSEKFTLYEIEQLAQSKRPNDFFFRNGSQVQMKSTAEVE